MFSLETQWHRPSALDPDQQKLHLRTPAFLPLPRPADPVGPPWQVVWGMIIYGFARYFVTTSIQMGTLMLLEAWEGSCAFRGS